MVKLPRWAKRPEVAIPLATLVAAIALVAGVLIVFRPDSDVSAAILAGVTAVLASTISVTVGRYFEKQRELEVQVRQKKIPQYEQFTDFWFSMLFRDKLGEEPLSEREMMSAMLEWTKPLIMWGSDDMVREWGRLRISFDPNINTARPTDAERAKAAPLFDFERFLVSVRRDAGYPDTRLQRGDILRLWINDIDRYL